MSACRTCGFVAADVDDACGSCGAPLAMLSVVGGRVRLDEHSDRVEVSVTNTGIVPASFVLRSSDARGFPPWLVGFPDLDVAVVVEPGATVPLRFLVDATRLPLGAASSIKHAGRAIVPLVTSVVRFDEGRAVRRVLAIELATEGRPAPSPRAASYRFVPRELLEDGASISRPFTVRNDGGHPVSLVGVSLAPRDVVVPRGAIQLAPEAIVALPGLPQALVIPPGGSVVVDARLRLLPGRLPPGALGVFAADVLFAVRSTPSNASSSNASTSNAGTSNAGSSSDGIEQTRASVDGLVGDGPRVRVAESLSVHTGGRPVRAILVIDNPGAVPVRVTGAEVLVPPGEPDDDDTAIARASEPPGSAWLRILDDDLVAGGGFLLQPDESREIHVVIDPEQRNGPALERPWGRRVVRFHHDGVPADGASSSASAPLVEPRLRGAGVPPVTRAGSSAAHADVVIAAELGRTRTLDSAILGVDFGTSNSSASLYFGPRAALQALAIDREAGRESLASTMFYVGASDPQGRGDFLFGQSADNAAPLAWTNLVKNLKSAVARDPSARWSFVDPKTGRLAETFGAQALLDRFIVELKRRSEDGLRALPMPALAALGLVDTGVRFKHAVFSHPVGADEAYVAALWTAARACRLVEEPGHGPNTAQQFAEERCIDEALAAVIAFVHIAAGLPEASARAIGDEERLLCFDIGGGTTDIAAVEVRGLRAFREDPSGRHVDVVLRASGGDPRFGGTDIDRLLAGFLLDEMAKRPELSALDIDEVRRATFFTAYDAFRRARGDATGASDAAKPQRARAVYSRATDVLRAAERIKLALASTKGAAEGNLFVPDLADWPTRGTAPPSTGRVELRVTRADLERVLAQPLARVASLIAPVLADAGWRVDDVTTLVFTGQSSRLDAIRSAVRAVVEQGRTPGARALNVIEPDGMAGFDPKRCVAQGAAVWGDSKAGGGGWLRVARRSRTALSSTLQSRRGPLLVEVPGLASGTALPARGRLELGEPQRIVVLYRAGVVAWTFDLPIAAKEIDIVIEGEERAHAIAGGMRTEGKRA